MLHQLTPAVPVLVRAPITRGISGGECMSTLPTPIAHSGLRGVWEVVSDLLIATALIWTLPLLLGAVGALVNRLLRIE